MVTCPYDKTKKFVLCPGCNKKDQVQTIFYGLPGSFDPKYHYAGCMSDAYCRAEKHCKRCNLDF